VQCAARVIKCHTPRAGAPDTTTEESTVQNSLTRVVTHGLAALVAAAPLMFQPAVAADAAMSSSQSKMAACSRQNKGKKGDDYKKAQSDCLKG
jgi:hypothetical protein